MTPSQDSQLNTAVKSPVGLIFLILIIGCLLVYFSIPKWGDEEIFRRARTAVTGHFVRNAVKSALEHYRQDNGGYPNTTEGLQALLTPPLGTETTWTGPYLELIPPDKMTLDPWAHVYLYRQPGTHNPDRYDVFSAGPDGIPGTADDIGNW